MMKASKRYGWMINLCISATPLCLDWALDNRVDKLRYWGSSQIALCFSVTRMKLLFAPRARIRGRSVQFPSSILVCNAASSLGGRFIHEYAMPSWTNQESLYGPSTHWMLGTFLVHWPRALWSYRKVVSSGGRSAQSIRS